MWIGLFLILLGLVVLAYPQILVALLAAFLIVSGVGLLVLHWRLRRIYRAWDQANSRWAQFIIRF